MAKKNSYRIAPHSDGWAVKREGNGRIAALHSTQAEAWSDGRRRARGSGGDVLLQARDGKILARNTYGSDPSPPKR
jgi:hypothetical protein